MKANEMIRTHGVEKLRLILEKYPNHTHMTDDARMFIDENSCIDFIKKDLDQAVKFSELKQLIGAHDRVGRLGGLKGSRARCLLEYMRDLRAIEDVESCQ